MRTLVFSILFAVLPALASNSGVTYQGRILKPDGTALSGVSTQFKLQLRTPDLASCLMYEEVQTQNLSNSNGAFSLTINDGSGTRTDTTGLTLDRIFANRGTFSFVPATCSSGSGTYTPTAADGRNLVVQFKDETMSTWEPIPPQKINFVPYAFESKQIAGFTADSLMRVVSGSGDPLTGLAPLSNAQYTELMALVNGTSNAFTKAGQLGGVALPTMSTGEVLGWNGSAWVSQTAVGGANSVTTAMLQNNAVDSSKIASGAVGTTQIASNVSINTSGTVGAAITTTRDFKIYATSPSSFYVGMLAPALSASYSLTWPMDDGNNGEVLTTNGSGVLSWAPAAASSQWTTQAPGINYMGGNVGIGTTSATASLSIAKETTATSGRVDGVNNYLAFNPSATASTLVWGQMNSVLANGSANLAGAQAYGSYNHVYAISTNAAGLGDAKGSMNQVQLAVPSNINNAVGAVGDVTNDTTGTINYAKGLVGTVNNDGAGTIGDAVGVFAGVTNAGTIANAYGVYIGPVAGTNKYGLFQSDTTNTNYLAGRVGIGTSSPFVRKFEVSQSSAVLSPAVNISPSAIGLTNPNTTNNNFVELGFNTNDLGGTHTTGAKIASVFTSHATNNVSADMLFLSRNSGSLAEKMRITSAGNVGIGTTSPTYKLDVFQSNSNGPFIRSFNDVSTAVGNAIGIQADVNSYASGASSSQTGFLSNIYNTNGSINGAIGYASQMGLGTGFILNRQAFIVYDAQVSGAGTIGTQYGLYVSDLTKGVENYGVYTAGTTKSYFGGNVGIGTTSPSARLMLGAGAATANSAPLKFTSGPLLTAPEDGALEYDGAGLWYTIGATRYVIPTNTAAGNYSSVSTISNAAGSITMTPMSGNSVIVNQSTTSTNPTSGALIVNGGAGVAGALNTGGNMTSGGSITATTNAVIPQIYGSTAASGGVRIDGTSDATKGNVYLASAGGKVGIGTTSPTDPLSVVTNSTNGIGVAPSAGVLMRGQILHGSNSAGIGGLGGLQIAAQGVNNSTGGAGNIHLLTPSANSGGATAEAVLTPKMTIRYDGNVGIGTTSPQALFQVQGATNEVKLGPTTAASGNSELQLIGKNSGLEKPVRLWSNWDGDLYVRPNAGRGLFFQDGSGATALNLTASGNVGIGTTLATSKLLIRDDPQAVTGNANPTFSNFTYIYPSGTTSATYVGSRDDVVIDSAQSYSAAVIRGHHSIATNQSTSTVGRISATENQVVNANTGTVTTAQGATGYIENQSTGTIGTAQALYAQVRRTGTGPITSGYGVYIGNIEATNGFGVYQADSTAKNYYAGNVGIGTTSPAAKLQVSGPAGNGIYLNVANTDWNPGVSGSAFSIGLGTPSGVTYTNLQASTAGGVGVGNIAINANGGNVGIGTTSPATTLDVAGTIRLRTAGSTLIPSLVGGWNQITHNLNINCPAYQVITAINGDYDANTFAVLSTKGSTHLATANSFWVFTQGGALGNAARVDWTIVCL